MKKLWYDCETYSAVPIRDGTYKYSSNAEIIVVTYAVDQGPVVVWDRTRKAEMPAELAGVLEEASEGQAHVYAHNAMFDRNVLLNNYYSLCPPIEQWRDTMIQSYLCALPGSLDKLCEILQVPLDMAKKKEGRKLIHLFCKPRPGRSKIARASRLTHPKEWQEFIEYAAADISAMRECYNRMPKWNHQGEWIAQWHLDQVINDRGFMVDIELATAAVEAVKQEQLRLRKRTSDATNGKVASTTQSAALVEHLLRDYAVSLPDLTRATLNRRLEDPDLPQGLKELLHLRLQQSSTSTSKYTSVMKAVQPDGRCRGTIQFGGASRTLRAAGRTFQPHNLPSRGLMNHGKIEAGIGFLKSGMVDLMFADEVMHLASSAIRGLLIAPPGKKLVIADLSNIEGRVAAWCAGEDWKVEAFRDFDKGTGHDIYNLAYAKSFNIKPGEVTPRQRSIGKVQELMLQYAGGVGAYVTGAAGYGFDLEKLAKEVYADIPKGTWFKSKDFYMWTLDQDRPTYGLSPEAFIMCESFKRGWRESNPQITSMWYKIEAAIREAYGNRGRDISCGLLTMRVDGNWLRVTLPSGRYLCYPGLKVAEDDRISYEGMGQYTRKWEAINSYGGKFFENFCQSISRDVLYNSMQAIEDAGYQIVLHVHDELICEVPDTDEFNVEGLCSLMTEPVDWMEGLPLSAAGFETKRYRK